MKNSDVKLKGIKLKFGGGFSVNDEIMVIAKDPDRFVSFKKSHVLTQITDTIDKEKPDMWHISHHEDGFKIYQATLYVFTITELNMLIDKVKSGEIK